MSAMLEKLKARRAAKEAESNEEKVESKPPVKKKKSPAKKSPEVKAEEPEKETPAKPSKPALRKPPLKKSKVVQDDKLEEAVEEALEMEVVEEEPELKEIEEPEEEETLQIYADDDSEETGIYYLDDMCEHPCDVEGNPVDVEMVEDEVEEVPDEEEPQDHFDRSDLAVGGKIIIEVDGKSKEGVITSMPPNTDKIQVKLKRHRNTKMIEVEEIIEYEAPENEEEPEEESHTEVVQTIDGDPVMVVKTRSTINVTKIYKESGEIVNEEHEQENLEVHQFVTTPAEAGIRLNRTIGLANYSSVSVAVDIKLPTYIEELDDALETAHKIAGQKMQSIVDQLGVE